MSSFLDGSNIADVRKEKVVRPNYRHITSMAYTNGVFFLTDGATLLFEEFNKNTESFYLTEISYGTKLSAFHVEQPITQPHPGKSIQIFNIIL